VATSLVVVANEIKPFINPWTILVTKRRPEVVINRFRIGHTWLTHGFLIRREEPDQSITCDEALTVKHILYCRNYDDIRTALNILDHLYEALGADQEKFQQNHYVLKNNQTVLPHLILSYLYFVLLSLFCILLVI
jgi:hypothetical protein